jgi:Fe2+ transport system protein FeoA
MPLASLEPGNCAVVDSVSANASIASRLLELGFVPGAVVQVIRQAPFGGPVQYRIQGVSLTMRTADAVSVRVRALSDMAGALAGSSAGKRERLELAECSV